MENRIIKIDLSNLSYEIDTIPEKTVRKYIGKRGLGAYLLYQLVKAKVDPLGEDNYLIFTAGPNSGTNFPYSSKSIAHTKSPQTGVYLYSSCSSTLAHQIKKAGFWSIAVRGIADSPTYLQINNGNVEFKDAAHLWGMEVNMSQQAILRESGKKAAVVTIGPAGEKLVRYAAALSEGPRYRAFGRGGIGCVMGAKKLKGIAVCGDREIHVGDERAFERVRKHVIDLVRKNPKWVKLRNLYGSAAPPTPLELSQAGIFPTYNWRCGQFKEAERISPETMEEWPKKPVPCAPFCLSPCSRYFEIKEGPYHGARCDGPEYEAFYAFGSVCGVSRIDAIVAAQQICDENGLDIMSAGVTIAFAMECFEKGLISRDDTDGIELRFGNDEAMVTMVRKIANLEGFGAQLATGVRQLSAGIKGSEQFAMQVKGLELGGYECRGLNGQALQYAIDNRGGCHHAYGLVARFEGFDGTGQQIKGKGELVKKNAIRRILYGCFPVCSFARGMFEDTTLADLASALFNEAWSVDDLFRVGERVMCQERLFNMREGVARKDDSLPLRLLHEPKPDGLTRGTVVPLESLKDDYYRAMGWDLETGNPTDAVLAALEIEK